ncbi:unnamed protein product [Acanthoscelides obtectus]|uniref:Uncharacterized protein n=1 Tax=Acanthoscelides obtectus TaxID=200917 RepID=A0A9P0P8W2_ACAOB|nr:unnamed protein product [Acanthoscelides obtectus]CAK1640965.1 hypothetical protein AOBTE_LOCUS12045 [Acanthoscelides obtectus]
MAKSDYLLCVHRKSCRESEYDFQCIAAQARKVRPSRIVARRISSVRKDNDLEWLNQSEIEGVKDFTEKHIVTPFKNFKYVSIVILDYDLSNIKKMSSRTKLIMKLSNQQASHSCVDIVEYEVGKDGILSPIHAQPSSKINGTLVNSNEVPPPKIVNSFDHIEFPVDLNDSASINNDNSTSFNHLEVPAGLKDPSILTDFDL